MMNDMIYMKNMDILNNRYPEVSAFISHNSEEPERTEADADIISDVYDIDGKVVLAADKGVLHIVLTVCMIANRFWVCGLKALAMIGIIVLNYFYMDLETGCM